MCNEMLELAERIRGLREACDVSVEEMAADLDVSPETYLEWEETASDVPVSALYHISRKFGVDLTEILTGVSPKLNTYQVVRRGEGKLADRIPGYHFEDMAWRYQNKLMQPLVVVLDPTSPQVDLVTHSGQEFNFVIEGQVCVTLGEKEIVLNPWDSIYFNPAIPHGQRAAGDVPAKFVTVVAE